MTNSEKSVKSFWKKPEGVTGMIGLALLGLGAIWGINSILPTLIQLMKNTYTALGLAAGLFVIISLLLNNRFRTTLWYLYKGFVRSLTTFVVELDPIKILESYVENIKEKIVKMDEQLTDLKGQIGGLGQKLEKKQKEWKLEMDRAEQAKKMDRKAEVTLHARQAGRLEDTIKNISTLHKKMEVIYKVLNQMKYYSEIMVKDTEYDVANRKDEREAMSKSHSVMKSALSIIQGNSDKKMLFDQAMEIVVDDIGQKIGEMDRMLEASTDFINSVDLDNAVYEERGLKMLEEFERKGMDTIFGKNNTVNTAENILNITPNKQPEVVQLTSTNNSDKKYF
jgi:phage shock protein A